ncbi:GT4 family glycosyltransferase PelF [Thermotoga neapolitana]|uniref:Lipopolysaccharide biosynthesis protein-related protein n=1 Tax=Thermotoga neapolitana (strain ATCC 49049 / DSM 4359 / NBRC 107923 / NS-E) TaxID=309803 RepID=B9K8I0_THENN|nr:GT4 family glycosyltransferase PelF [Thermotoga neapolitana]ACM23263.1 Lipopolysaccharide biosynthesis protein-related protein [Thermotoga neapolitana DSM 4359]
MKVGLVLEGTYPYVTGGVSSWVHTLIINLPEFDFEIYYLKPDNKVRSVKYEVPSNVIAIHELNIFGDFQPKISGKVDFDPLERIISEISSGKAIESIIPFAIEFIEKNTGKSIRKMLKTRRFWSIMVKIYENFFSERGFTEYYWMIMNLFLPVINALQFTPDRCDIYHVPSTGYASLVGINGKVIYGSPLLITEHGIYHKEREREILLSSWVPDSYKPMWVQLFRIMSMIAYEMSDLLTTLSRKNQAYQLKLGADPEKMIVIPNAIDVDAYSLPKEPHEGFIIGFVGRVSRIKDLKTAIRAISLVKEMIGQREKLKFLVIGPADEEDYLTECKRMVEVLKLEDTVEFLGPQNVKEYYPKMDLLLLSSVSEGQPLVILEAMASGLPIVATDVGSCKEMLYDRDGQCGIVVPPKDHFSMAKAIVRIYEDNELREMFSKNTRRVVQKYRLDRMIESYRKIYLSLIEKRVPSIS